MTGLVVLLCILVGGLWSVCWFQGGRLVDLEARVADLESVRTFPLHGRGRR